MVQNLTIQHRDEPSALDITGLCLLSLDGGGVRGLSTLYILKGLMGRLNHERQNAGLPKVKPCEVFDLISGTSTGGLIAIMLGRLEMDVDACIASYSELMKKVFEEKSRWLPFNWRGRMKAGFDSAKLKTAIEDVISSAGASPTDAFNGGDDRGCRTFVCATARETGSITRLRSYMLHGDSGIPATISQAVLATSAARGFFDPVSIGAREFEDDALGANNPVDEVESEAGDIWNPNTGDLKPLVKCFVSIGTGNPGKKALEDNVVAFLSQSLVRIVTNTEETEKRFFARWAKSVDEKRYFRFNVDQGLQDIGLAEYKEQGKMQAATEEYLGHQGQKFRLRDCVENLRLKQNKTNQSSVDLIIARNARLSREAQELSRRLAEQFYDQVLDWIHNSKLDSRKIEQPLKDTDRCFMDSDLFQNWLRGDRSLLWCYESQGTGKTVLARSVYEHVNMQVKQDDEKVALSMISCSFDSDHTSDHLMANMLRQIAKQPKTWRKDYILSDTMKDLYRDHAKDGAQKHTTDDQIRKALQNELKRFQSVYIILDGLDELAAQEQRRLLLRTLHELKSVEYSLRIIVFSRKLPDIQEWFMNHGCVKSQSVELVPSQEYLSAYIDSRIFASDHLKRIIGERKSLVDEIRERVYSNASNTYLLAKLHIERLSDRNEIQTVRQLRSALNDLQNNFEGAYEGVFDRIKRIWSGDAYKRIEQFLFLVWQAKEPMSAPALEHALAALRKDVSFDHHFIQELPDAVVPSSDLVSECAGLVEMDETSQIVRLTHETIRNYLSKALKDAFPTPDLIMAESCLSYLQLPAFEVGAYTADHAEDKALDRLKEYCFLAYASRYWGRHAHNCADPNLHQHILKLVTNANLLSTIAQVMRICDRNNAWDVDREVTGLHVCAHFGLTESVRSLLEQSGTQLIDKKDARDTTALMYAVIAKHQDTVRVLLDAGATITGSCVRGYTALHRACCSFDECIWNLIVSSSKDISVNLKSQEVRFHKLTALRWAISRNYVDGVNLLLKREDTDVYVEDLDSAASHDYSAILQTLINRGFVGDYDRNYRTDLLSYLLIRALCFGKLESASVLLNHGANLEWRDDFHATPIIRVIDSGNIQGLEFIWKRANRYVKDKFKRGVLHSAARGSKEAIMGWMLERDKALGVNHQSDVGDTPLHDVVLEGDNVKIAKLLLDHKADATIRNYKGRSAVDLASDYDREGLLNLFLVDHGLSAHHSGEVIDPDRLIGFVSRERADVNRDQTDINVLQSLQMFTGDWIHACNYVPNEEIQPDSPLIKAIRTGKRRTAMFLLEKGANVDGLDRFHMTALHWASRLGYEDLVKDLVSRKANINAICRLFECKPVDDAASHSHLDLALYLLEQGDDESAPLNRTLMPQLLGQACEIGRLKAVRCLFKAGAPLFLRDGEGQSPRQKALSKGHHEIVSFIDQYI